MEGQYSLRGNLRPFSFYECVSKIPLNCPPMKLPRPRNSNLPFRQEDVVIQYAVSLCKLKNGARIPEITDRFVAADDVEAVDLASKWVSSFTYVAEHLFIQISVGGRDVLTLERHEF
jgi:hypothetical protein